MDLQVDVVRKGRPRKKRLEEKEAKELGLMDAYWRAANYLSVGQIYLYGNPLLKVPLKIEHVKPRLLGGAPRRD